MKPERLKKDPQKPAAQQPARSEADESGEPWYGRTLAPALLGSLLMWASFPPLGLAPVAWIAPIGWLMLIRRRRLAGRRPYGSIYLAGLAFWLAMLYWLVLPHWAGVFSWLAMSLYVAFYIPFFVGLSRVAVHALRVPLVIAAPVVWTGLELVRAHVLEGFLIAALGHTQYKWVELIQISDLVGGYGVSFLVMFVAACLTRALPSSGAKITAWPLVPAGVMVAAVLAYGYARTAGDHTRNGPRIALIQGSIDTKFGMDPTEYKRTTYDQYMQQTCQAIVNPDVDLIIWPESMYPWTLILVDEGAFVSSAGYARELECNEEEAKKLEKLSQSLLVVEAQESRESFRQTAADVAAMVETHGPSSNNSGIPMLVGLDTIRYGPGTIRRYGSSALIDRSGNLVGVYHKMHRLMFGEYVPFAEYFQWLYEYSPLSSGIELGDEPKVFDVAGARVMPNICYETVLPHLVRGRFDRLRRAGLEPDVLVVQSNDGWFYGSSALDLHLICNVFRAVECRRPLVAAANTGFSASVDADGRILQKGPRRAVDYLIADVRLDDRHSQYVSWGDWFASTCAFCCGCLLAVGIWRFWTAARGKSKLE